MSQEGVERIESCLSAKRRRVEQAVRRRRIAAASPLEGRLDQLGCFGPVGSSPQTLPPPILCRSDPPSCMNALHDTCSRPCTFLYLTLSHNMPSLIETDRAGNGQRLHPLAQFSRRHSFRCTASRRTVPKLDSAMRVWSKNCEPFICCSRTLCSIRGINSAIQPRCVALHPVDKHMAHLLDLRAWLRAGCPVCEFPVTACG